MSFAESASQHGAETVVQLVPMTNDGIPVPLASIVSGKDDAYLRFFATAVKQFRRNIILSFGHEMNGTWYALGLSSHIPENFRGGVAAYCQDIPRGGRLERDLARTVNVVDNNIPSPIPSPNAWWPGDSYVNWVGIDGYYYKSSSAFASLFGPTIAAVRGLTDDPIS